MKFKLLLKTFILSFLLLLTAGKTYAQEYKSIPYFEMSTPVSTTQITKTNIEKSNVFIKVDHITTITIRQGSFTQDINALIYKGNWDILTKGANSNSSPIAAYYIAFLDSQGKEVIPLRSVQIEVYNNYIGATATYTPLSRGNGFPDSTNIKTFPNQAVVREMLTSNNAGFIVSINRVIEKNDPSLNPTITDPNPSVILTPSISPTQTPSTVNSFVNQNVYLILALAIIIISISVLAILLLLRSFNKPKI